MRIANERIDVVKTVRPMSSNIPGHVERMEFHCKRVKREYFDTKLFKVQCKGEKLRLMRDGRSRD